MAREIKFIIAVNLDDKTCRIDDDSFMLRYSAMEQVWDTDLEEWTSYQEGEYELALEILNTKKLEND
jgi:hypothetical protein